MFKTKKFSVQEFINIFNLHKNSNGSNSSSNSINSLANNNNSDITYIEKFKQGIGKITFETLLTEDDYTIVPILSTNFSTILYSNIVLKYSLNVSHIKNNVLIKLKPSPYNMNYCRQFNEQYTTTLPLHWNYLNNSFNFSSLNVPISTSQLKCKKYISECILNLLQSPSKPANSNKNVHIDNHMLFLRFKVNNVNNNNSNEQQLVNNNNDAALKSLSLAITLTCEQNNNCNFGYLLYYYNNSSTGKIERMTNLLNCSLLTNHVTDHSFERIRM